MKFLSQIKGIHKNDAERLREFLEAVVYTLRTGCQWRLLPFYYGNWRAVHKRFKQWSKRGIWKKLFEFVQKDPDMDLGMIDSTIVRSHACSAGYGFQEQQALGRSKGGFITKIHAFVDALVLPLKFIFTAGNRNDMSSKASM